MCVNFNYSVKLGSMFTALREIDLPIEEFDFPVSIGNALKRGGIHNLRQLLAQSGNELEANIRWGSEQSRRRKVEYIIDTLERFNTNGIPEWGEGSNGVMEAEEEFETIEVIDLEPPDIEQL